MSDDEGRAGGPGEFIEKQWTGKYHGMLEKKSKFMGKEKWHQRWFVLSETGTLLRFEHQSASRPKSAISLAKASVKTEYAKSPKPFAFQIVTNGGETLTLRALSEETKSEWIKQLREVITDVSQRPVDD